MQRNHQIRLYVLVNSNNKCVEGIQQIVKQHKKEIEQIVENINSMKIEDKKKIKYEGKEVCITDMSKLNDNLNEIVKYKEEGRLFNIRLDFIQIQNYNERMETLQWLNNNKLLKYVVWLWIKIDNHTYEQINEIMDVIERNAKNIWWMYIYDWNDDLNNQIHERMIKSVIKQEIIRFELLFQNNDNQSEKMKMIKQYNMIINEQKDIEQLWYQIDGSLDKKSYNRQQVVQIIEEINNM